MNRAVEASWEGVTWDDAELAVLRAGARLTLRQKLQWLEEADRLAGLLRRARVRYPASAHPDGWMLVEPRPAPDQAPVPRPPGHSPKESSPDV